MMAELSIHTLSLTAVFPSPLNHVQILNMDDFRGTATAAYETVDVPDSVIDLLTGLRNYLQVRRGVGGTNG